MWQKLSICFKNDGNISPVYLYWAKNGVTDFTTLKGYVIFAYPEYRIIKTDPKNPDTGWASRISTLVFPLSGNNVQIVPKNSIGYKMDNTCNASTWNNNAYSYTNISSLFQGDSLKNNNQSYRASVNCFVSTDFDGTYARIVAEGDVSGNTFQDYDLNKKGTWQKLQIDFKAKSGVPAVYLYWSKNGIIDFSSLKGYVIYAYPQYRPAPKKDSISILKEIPDTSKIRNYLKRHIKELNEKYLSPKNTGPIDGINFPKEIENIVNSIKISNVNLKVNEEKSSFNQYEASLLIDLFPFIYIRYSTGFDKDPVRTWIANFVSEDTTYFGYKNVLSVGSISNKTIGERILRWRFSWQIYLKEFNWRQKIMGGGFNFLNWYGFYFLKDKTASDWPHNPFLAVLLYSGIIGLALYLLLVYKAFYYYIEYIKEYYILFSFFLITFFFSFFSGSSPFDPPIMGFFIMLPFFIHSIHKRAKKSPD